jgi:hypothetical protein
MENAMVHTLPTYEEIIKNCVLPKNSEVLTSNIFAMKSEDRPLPYCKTEAESVSFKQVNW